MINAHFTGQKIFSNWRGFMLLMLGLIIGMLGAIIWRLKRIENLLEFWTDLPKNEKYWGWGKHKK